MFSLKKNVNLKNYTTFKIGGPAKYFCAVHNEGELLEAVEFAKLNKLKVLAIGEGSDILVNDHGFDGLVIKYLEDSVQINNKGRKVYLTASAGLSWDDLVKKSVECELQGVECMSGIPGTVGAAPVQNIGAYGQEVKDTFVSLRALDINNITFTEYSNSDCKFSYRESIFKQESHWQKFIITSVTLGLKQTTKPVVKYDSLVNYFEEKGINNPTLADVREAVLTIRSTKFEDYKNFPNAGSFFKNPTLDTNKMVEIRAKYSDVPCYDNGDGTFKCFAGWFIEQSGWKGKKIGNAQVSSKHALILLNPEGKAKAEEIKHLAKRIAEDVMKKFNVNLQREVQYI